MKRQRRYAVAALTVGLVAVLGATACGNTAPGGSGGDTGSAPSAKVSDKARAKLPGAVVQRGVLRLATDPASPPYDFTDDRGQVVGLEQDLAHGVAERLGLRLEVSKVQFPSIIPAIQSGRYDVGVDALGDNLDREKIVDLVDLYTEGTAITVPENNPHRVKSVADTCGLTAAVVAGSFPVDFLKKQNERCADPITISEFPSQNDAVSALRSGRADFGLQTAGVAKYTYENLPQTGGIKLKSLSENRYMISYHSMAVAKSNSGLRDAIVVALQEMVDDGSYAEIFRKWKLEANMIDTITYNDAKKFADSFMDLD